MIHISLHGLHSGVCEFKQHELGKTMEKSSFCEISEDHLWGLAHSTCKKSIWLHTGGGNLPLTRKKKEFDDNVGVFTLKFIDGERLSFFHHNETVQTALYILILLQGLLEKPGDICYQSDVILWNGRARIPIIFYVFSGHIVLFYSVCVTELEK